MTEKDGRGGKCKGSDKKTEYDQAKVMKSYRLAPIVIQKIEALAVEYNLSRAQVIERLVLNAKKL
jgi:hypothetical protein